MRRKFDIFSFLAIFFVVWYILTSTIYILEYYANIKLVTLLGESLTYPLMFVATLGGAFIGEAHSIIIAWSPIVALIIGIAGWVSRERNGKYFLILPCLSLVAQLLLFFVQGTKVFAFLYYAFPIFSILFLALWALMDVLIIVRER